MADEAVIQNEVGREDEPAVTGLIRQEVMRLSAEDPEKNAGEILTLNQLENDLKVNPFAARGLEAHLGAVMEAVKERQTKFGESVEAAWAQVVSSAIGAGVLTEAEREYLVAEGHGRKETLVSIAALSHDYPTADSAKPSHFSDLNTPAVYSLGREIGHDGRGTIFITQGAFDMVKGLYIRSKT